MKVKIISMNDGIGGASIAGNNLHKMLKKNSISSEMLIRDRHFDEVPHVTAIRIPRFISKLIHKIDSSFLKLYPARKKYPWNVGIFGIPLLFIGINNNEKIIINWIPGIISIFSLLKLNNQRIILHDAWLFTGGCHVPVLCNNFRKNCQNCPQLSIKNNYSLATLMKTLKLYIINKSNLKLICPSLWLYKFGIESGINEKNLKYIPNIINCDNFPCKEFEQVNQVICVIGGHNFKDPAKGMEYLEKFLNIYKNYKIKSKILIVGGGYDDKYNSLSDSNIIIENLDVVTNQILMSSIYKSSKVLIHFSLLENLSNTLIESVLSGTPAVCWDVGGNSEIMDYYQMKNTVEFENISKLSENVRDIMLMNNNVYSQYAMRLRSSLLKRFSNINTIESYINLLKND